MIRNNYPEMNKLIKLLAKADIPFEVVKFPFNPIDLDGNETDGGLQIFAPSMDDSQIDAVCHFGTYGYREGFIEIMSKHEPDVVGWLTAEGAFEYFKKAIKG